MSAKRVIGIFLGTALAVALYFGIPFFRLYLLPETELFSRGQVQAGQGDCEGAIRHYRMLLRKDPVHTTTMAFMADCQRKLGNFDEAIATSQKLVKLESSPPNWQRLLELYRETGDFDRADAIEKQAELLLGRDPKAAAGK